MYYRVTCDNVGIYEYLKSYIFDKFDNSSEVWNGFLNHRCNSWLKKPELYNDYGKCYCSYFTESGFILFINNTFKEIKKIIDDKNFKIDIININDKDIVYGDEYQVVIVRN